MKHDVALTETARLAVSVNSKHREVQRLGRTAKDIAAEIGEELIKVKQKLAHGEFKQWVPDNCAFSYDSTNDYMKLAKAKMEHAPLFNRCNSIREVLALGKAPKPTEEPQQKRSATLDDLRKVERLRALSFVNRRSCLLLVSQSSVQHALPFERLRSVALPRKQSQRRQHQSPRLLSSFRQEPRNQHRRPYQ